MQHGAASRSWSSILELESLAFSIKIDVFPFETGIFEAREVRQRDGMRLDVNKQAKSTRWSRKLESQIVDFIQDMS